MGQKHNINPDQLTMFERAGDLANPEKFYPGDALYDDDTDPKEVRDSVKKNKLSKSHKQGLYNDIAANGVKNPVDIVHKEDLGYGDFMHDDTGVHHDTGVYTSRGLLRDGHHRVFAQADINPDALIPVKWG